MIGVEPDVTFDVAVLLFATAHVYELGAVVTGTSGILGLVWLQIAESVPLTTGSGLTVTTTRALAPRQPSKDVGVMVYATVPKVESLGLCNTSVIVSVTLFVAPVTRPVSAAPAQVKVAPVPVVAESGTFIEGLLLHVVLCAVVRPCTPGAGLTTTVIGIGDVG